MPVVTLSEKARQIEARRRAMGGIDAARVAVARNKGTHRTASKRALLKTLEDKAREQERPLPFAANF
jgi:hypothetical protein